MNIWPSIYKSKFKPFLDVKVSHEKRGLLSGLYHRATGFEIVFNELLKSKQQDFLIFETGSTRRPDNWKDGNSGCLFAEFVRIHGGFVKSVDIDQSAVDAANAHIDSKYHQSFCSDSVAWLNSQSNLDQVDLFYLDSWDVKWDNDIASAEHHLKEFQTIEKHLKSGCIVAIDDNSRLATTGKRTGKGRLIVEYLEQKNKNPIYDQYQIIYKF